MIKIIQSDLATLAIITIVVSLGFICCGGIFETQADAVTLSTEVQKSISLSLSTSTVCFGDLTAGTPSNGDGASTSTVTTNDASGYLLKIHDGSDTNSALVHTDTSTYIADYAGTIGTPTSWTGTGLGICVYAADTSKESKWGTGAAHDDTNNKYAGAPASATTIHTVTSNVTSDETGISFRIDVPSSQKSGSYSGDATITAVNP